MILAHMTPDELKREIARQDYEVYKEEVTDRLRFQAEFAQTALRGLMLVNGGAIVALFTLIGNAKLTLTSNLLWWAFGCFVGGLTLTIVANISAFFSQAFYMKSTISQLWNAQREMLGAEPQHDFEREYRVGERWETGGVAAAVLALVAFLVGSGLALSAVAG